jgi:hypothetical protein
VNVVKSQTSAVQGLVSTHCALDVQQPVVVCSFLQTPLSQVSVVQRLLSLQSAAVVQPQPAPPVGVKTHCRVVALHESVVQLLPSSQSAAVEQQPWI